MVVVRGGGHEGGFTMGFRVLACWRGDVGWNITVCTGWDVGDRMGWVG